MAAIVVVVGAAGFVDAVELDAYLKAASSGIGGEIAGRVFEERRKPDLPDRGLQDTAVILLPQPGALMQRLENVRRGARDSDRAFRAAVPRMLQALEEHEAAVRAAGGSDLVFRASAGADGTFTVPRVPEGTWILVGRAETTVPGTGGQIPKKDQEMYRVRPPLKAYRSVRLWVREITVVGGRVEAVELTDRNVWFTGVVEVR